jgi:hypothetical protein
VILRGQKLGLKGVVVVSVHHLTVEIQEVCAEAVGICDIADGLNLPRFTQEEKIESKINYFCSIVM